MAYSVTVVPGDGIGPEVIEATCRILDATGVAFSWDPQQVGAEALTSTGSALPEAVLESIRKNTVCLKGPVATSTGMVGFPSVNVALRRQLGLFAQVRPSWSHIGLRGTFPGVDLIVLRDTTEDLYAGIELQSGSAGAVEVIDVVGRHGQERMPDGSGLSIKFVSEPACRRLVEFAFDYVRRNSRRKVTVVHKATVMRCTDGLFLEVARDVAGQNADVEYDEQQVDSLCARLVRNPQSADVLVMGNQYGDIVSDLAAGLIGGVGVAPGANFGTGTAVFEPVHGTAPRHVGRSDVNPVGAILSGAMLLHHLGETAAARRVEEAVEAVLSDGRAITPDLRHPQDARPAVGTGEMADAVLGWVRRG